MSRLAVIPARGGSKRIPDKNIRDFCGKPMISHALESARSSRLFDTIHVSTDSETIVETVVELGFPIDFMRPHTLADDHTPIMPVLKFVTDTYAQDGQEFEQVWLLMACAPLVRAGELISANQLYEETGGQQPLLAVSEYPAPVEWAFDLDETNHLIPVQPGMFAKRSQDIRSKYFDAGSFAIFPSSIVRNSEGAGSDSGFIGYPLPKGTAIDIDDEEDWRLAEAVFRASVA